MSVKRIGFPVAGCTGFTWTSMFDAWTGGYAEPGFCGTAGLAATGTGVADSTFGVGVTDFGTDASMDEGRWESFRRLEWRGCGLQDEKCY